MSLSCAARLLAAFLIPPKLLAACRWALCCGRRETTHWRRSCEAAGIPCPALQCARWVLQGGLWRWCLMLACQHSLLRTSMPSFTSPHAKMTIAPLLTTAPAALLQVPVSVCVSGEQGSPLVLTLSDDAGNVATAATDVPLQPAQQRSMTAADVERGVGQLGDNVLLPTGLDLSGLALSQGGRPWRPDGLGDSVHLVPASVCMHCHAVHSAPLQCTLRATMSPPPRLGMPRQLRQSSLQRPAPAAGGCYHHCPHHISLQATPCIQQCAG